jgi:hypothetical protein
MSNILKIPESLQFYFENEQQASAIQQVIELESIPIGLTWEEVEQYNIAKVSALSTQLDHWLFLKEVWESTWGKTLKNSSYKEVDPEDYGEDYSMDDTWDNGYLYKIFEFKDNRFCFYCGILDNSHIQLGFYVESKGENYDISNNLALSTQWNDADADERWTSENLVEIKDKSEIDIEPLIDLAQEVISKLSEKI